MFVQRLRISGMGDSNMRFFTIVLFVGLFVMPLAGKDDGKGKPPVDDNQLIKVVSVAGSAEKFVAGNDGKGKWVALKADEVIGEKTIIRTGLRTKVALKFPDGTEIKINRATKIGIDQYRKSGNDVRARLGLKYGGLHAKIEKGSGKTDYKVSTPVATLSVRGSESEFGFAGDAGLGLHVADGMWEVNAGKGKTKKTYGPGQFADAKGGASVKIMMQRSITRIADRLGLTRRDRMSQANTTQAGRGTVGLPGPGGGSSTGGPRLGRPPRPDPEDDDDDS